MYIIIILYFVELFEALFVIYLVLANDVAVLSYCVTTLTFIALVNVCIITHWIQKLLLGFSAPSTSLK